MNLENIILKIPIKLYHKASPILRNKIKLEGLKAQIGDSYIAHWRGTKEEKYLKPAIFAYDKDVEEYDTTWDDDIWEIETLKTNKSKWTKDLDKYMANKGCFMIEEDIPKEALRLVYKGTGKDKF